MILIIIVLKKHSKTFKKLICNHIQNERCKLFNCRNIKYEMNWNKDSDLPPINHSLIKSRPPRSRTRRSSHLPLKNSLPYSHSNNDMAAEDKNQWKNMENVIHPKDDFLCFPNTENDNDLPTQRKSIIRRKSSSPIVPADRSSTPPLDGDSEVLTSEDISFQSICDYDNQQSNLDFVLSGTEELMSKMREELGFYLSLSSKEMQKMCDLIYNPIQSTRIYFIAKKLYGHFQVEKYRQHILQLQNNIRIIAELEDFIKQSEKKPYVDFLLFQKAFLCGDKKIREASDKAEQFENYLNSLPEMPNKIDWTYLFLDTSNKTGRIMHRLKTNIGEMTYYDIEVIIKALCNDKTQVPRIRQLIFDLAWQQYIFPFVEVLIMELPNIFDLTPRIFTPPFLSDQVLDTPFSTLNSTDWPFKNTSENLFLLLIETDPFIIADKVWDIISQITQITNQIVIDSGGDPADADIGFEVLFKYLLVIVFAFGVSEILEVMSFCGLFYEFTDCEDSQRQFAMTHCNGLVKYISSMNSVELHNKFGKKQ